MAGLKTITDLLKLYKVREIFYLQSLHGPSHPKRVNAIVELYTDILEFQARLTLHSSKSSVIQGILSTLERDDWHDMLKKFKPPMQTVRCTWHFSIRT